MDTKLHTVDSELYTQWSVGTEQCTLISDEHWITHMLDSELHTAVGGHEDLVTKTKVNEVNLLVIWYEKPILDCTISNK